jgi:hypothetical protein
MDTKNPDCLEEFEASRAELRGGKPIEIRLADKTYPPKVVTYTDGTGKRKIRYLFTRLRGKYKTKSWRSSHNFVELWGWAWVSSEPWGIPKVAVDKIWIRIEATGNFKRTNTTTNQGSAYKHHKKKGPTFVSRTAYVEREFTVNGVLYKLSRERLLLW